MTPEKRVQNEIVNYLNTLQDQGFPVFVERRNAGGFSYKMGISDLYAVINGRHLEIEVKRPKGKMSMMQLKWREKCINLHIDHVCVDSLSQLQEKLLEILNHSF